MVYFPKIDLGPAEPTKCPGCDKWYVPNPAKAGQSCCVMHYPGSCCHYSETEVDAPEQPMARIELTAMGDPKRIYLPREDDG